MKPYYQYVQTEGRFGRTHYFKPRKYKWIAKLLDGVATLRVSSYYIQEVDPKKAIVGTFLIHPDGHRESATVYDLFS